MTERETNWIEMKAGVLEGCVVVAGNVVAFSGRARGNTRHAIYDLHIGESEEGRPVGALWEWPSTGGERDYSLALSTCQGRFQGRLEPSADRRGRFRINPHPPIGMDP